MIQHDTDTKEQSHEGKGPFYRIKSDPPLNRASPPSPPDSLYPATWVFIPSLTHGSNRQNYFHQQYALTATRTHHRKSVLNDDCRSHDSSDSSS